MDINCPLPNGPPDDAKRNHFGQQSLHWLQSWFSEVLCRLDGQKGILLTPSRLSRVPRRYAGTSSGINEWHSL